jgi:branched-chain amino acid transport system permease protein
MVALLLVLLLYRTPLGLLFRATADNALGASLLGVNPRRIAAASWLIGGGVTALGGILIFTKIVLVPSIGTTLTFNAFAAVVLGGFGSISGAILGGVLLGLAQAAVASTIGAGFEPLVSLIVMIAILRLRPTGLVGERG